MTNYSKIKSTIILSFLFIVFTSSCRNGCTIVSSKIVEKETEVRNIDNFKIKITANKVKYTGTNARGLLRNKLRITRNSWFGTNYTLKINDRKPNKDLIRRYAKEEADLTQVLKKFRIEFSPDKQHIAIGDNDTVFDFLHLLKTDKAFFSHRYYYKKNKFTPKTYEAFNKIKWKTFPPAEQLFDSLITSDFAGNEYFEILENMPPGNKYEISLIKNWDCPVAVGLFTKKRVKQIIKASPEWKNIAVEKLETVISKKMYGTFKSKSYDLVRYIDDASLLTKIDSIIFNIDNKYYNEFNYFIERISNKKHPLKPEIVNSLIDMSKSTLDSINDKDLEVDTKEAVKILLKTENYDFLRNFLNTSINPAKYKVFRFMDLRSATIFMYENYPSDLQKLIVEKYNNYIQNLPEKMDNSNISYIFEFLKNKIPCSDAKKLYQKLKVKMEPWGKKPDC